MIVLVGNAPGSGSTLLADLLDSVPGFACGPEAKIFSCRDMYLHFKRARERADRHLSFFIPSVYLLRQRFLPHKYALSAFGLDKNSLLSMLHSTHRFKNFITQFKHHYLNFRGSDKDVWAEKTPENIHCASYFLDLFEDSYFIHVVRDPRYVFGSARNNRGFACYIASSIWLIETASGYGLREHPRCLELHYEKLVSRPLETISDLAKRITGRYYDPDQIGYNYKKNKYRMGSEKRIRSWTVPMYGTVDNANERMFSPQLEKEIEALSHMRINPLYARHFGLPQVSYRELCKHYNYLLPSKGYRKPLSDVFSKAFLLAKYTLDLINGDCLASDMKTYLNPIIL